MTNEQQIKLCKDCAHFRRFWVNAAYSKCAASPEPVTGAPGRYCSISRDHGPCHSDGRLWTAKPRPWWRIWGSP